MALCTSIATSFVVNTDDSTAYTFVYLLFGVLGKAFPVTGHGTFLPHPETFFNVSGTHFC
jgi:hypothetical protein